MRIRDPLSEIFIKGGNRFAERKIPTAATKIREAGKRAFAQKTGIYAGSFRIAITGAGKAFSIG